MGKYDTHVLSRETLGSEYHVLIILNTTLGNEKFSPQLKTAKSSQNTIIISHTKYPNTVRACMSLNAAPNDKSPPPPKVKIDQLSQSFTMASVIFCIVTETVIILKICFCYIVA
jgi:hypothetical protein